MRLRLRRFTVSDHLKCVELRSEVDGRCLTERGCRHAATFSAAVGRPPYSSGVVSLAISSASAPQRRYSPTVGEGSPKQKERFSRAWVIAAASAADFTYEIVADDERGVDMTVHSHHDTLDFQLKATSNPEVQDGCLVFDRRSNLQPASLSAQVRIRSARRDRCGRRHGRLAHDGRRWDQPYPLCLLPPPVRLAFDFKPSHDPPQSADEQPSDGRRHAGSDGPLGCEVGTVTDDTILSGQAPQPTDVTEWLRLHGWTKSASLGDIAQRWQNNTSAVVVPMLTSSPDFGLRWSEMLNRLAGSFDTDPAGVLLAIAKAGSDIAEFRASGQIDDSIPLGDASKFIDSIRRAMQAAANSVLQPRSYYGHSLPDAARDHARNVRMGQTRRGSYIVPVISRLPILQPEEADDAVLFDEVGYQPFARSAMLKLAQGLVALRDLTHASAEPTGSKITEAVGVGLSSELCEAVANTLEMESIVALDVAFTWAERLPASSAPESVRLESEAVAPATARGQRPQG